MQSYAFFLGSHPSLSALEVYALMDRIGASVRFTPDFFPAALEVKGVINPKETLSLLGGTPIITRMVGSITKLSAENLLQVFPEAIETVSRQKKPVISISWVSLSEDASDITRHDLQTVSAALKRILKESYSIRGIRFILPKHGTMCSTAQFYHAGIPDNGVAIVLLGDSGKIHVGVVSAVQDIVSFAQRDRGRPSVDPGSGMLPLKVARMMINLSCIQPGGVLYDPFSGTGTISLEACTLGITPIASDISEKQVHRTEENLRWLGEVFPSTHSTVQKAQVFLCDIVKHAPPIEPGSIHAVVTEGWLGPARTTSPTPSDMEKTFVRSEHIIHTMLKQVQPLLQKDGLVICGVPAFRIKGRIIHAPFLKNLPLDPMLPLSWNEWSHPVLRTARQGTLLYGRPDAIVLREIVRIKPSM